MEEMEEWIIGVVGGEGVGKSSLVVRIISSSFSEEHEETIEDSYCWKASVDDSKCNVEIIDTGSSSDYSELRLATYSKCHGIICVYEINSRKSFEKMHKLCDEIINQRSNINKPLIPIIIVGNKNDLIQSREVSSEEGKKFADGRGNSFIETSAKKNQNVDHIFRQIIRNVRKQINNNINNNNNNIHM